MARCLSFVLYPGVSRHQTVSNRLFCNNSQYGVEYLIRPDFQALGVLAWFYPNVLAVILFCCDLISISGCRLWEAPMLESGADLRDGRKWIPGKKVYHMTYHICISYDIYYISSQDPMCFDVICWIETTTSGSPSSSRPPPSSSSPWSPSLARHHFTSLLRKGDL